MINHRFPCEQVNWEGNFQNILRWWGKWQKGRLSALPLPYGMNSCGASWKAILVWMSSYSHLCAFAINHTIRIWKIRKMLTGIHLDTTWHAPRLQIKEQPQILTWIKWFQVYWVNGGGQAAATWTMIDLRLPGILWKMLRVRWWHCDMLTVIRQRNKITAPLSCSTNLVGFNKRGAWTVQPAISLSGRLLPPSKSCLVALRLE